MHGYFLRNLVDNSRKKGFIVKEKIGGGAGGNSLGAVVVPGKGAKRNGKANN